MDSTMQRAARKILKMWQSFRDRRVFAYLRHAVCRAEVSLTHQVLRKIAPIEAFILRDPTLHARLRFRFGGSSFPPVILYKIFVNANVQYVAGTTKILAGSKAANDACDLMRTSAKLNSYAFSKSQIPCKTPPFLGGFQDMTRMRHASRRISKNAEIFFISSSLFVISGFAVSLRRVIVAALLRRTGGTRV